jgi:GDP-L-fucose synthase
MVDAGPRFDLTNKRVWVAGHRGMVGSALLRRLGREPCTVLTVSREHCDLRRQDEVEAWLGEALPDAILLAAARGGGSRANDRLPAPCLYDNLMIETNVIHAAWRVGVTKLLLLGAGCVYPELAPQPISEASLLSGQLESTNHWYAIAKIAGIMLCGAYRRQYGCDFISVVPTNLYGPGDNFDLMTSHVVPALIAKMHVAKEVGAPVVAVWGSGQPRRDFMHVDDLADACVHLLEAYSDESPINVGSAADLTIAELAELVRGVVGFTGELRYDLNQPDGMPRKLLDVRRLEALGWAPRIALKDGLADTYRWYGETAAMETLPKMRR